MLGGTGRPALGPGQQAGSLGCRPCCDSTTWLLGPVTRGSAFIVTAQAWVCPARLSPSQPRPPVGACFQKRGFVVS